MTRLCDELLQGAIDLHQHAAPSVFERVTDDIGLALESRQRGMRAVLLKAHEHDTTGRAALVRRQVPGIETFGGIVLNHSVGGFNPQAVWSRESHRRTFAPWSRRIQHGCWESTRGIEEVTRRPPPRRPLGPI